MEEIILSPDEKAKLIKLHKNLKEKRLADRVKCILLLGSGYTHKQIAEILLLDDRTIGRYKELYSKGTDQLLEWNYKGRVTKLTKEQEKELSKHIEEQLYSSSKEIVAYIKLKYDVDFTHDGLVITLHRLGFSYKKTKSVPSKANRERQENFVKEYKKLRANLKSDEIIYFMDAVHPTHNSSPGYAWIKKGMEKEIKANTGRQRLNISGVYSPLDQEVIIRDDEKINSESTIEFFKMIELKHPELKRIYIILDNARYYHSKEVKHYLLTSKIELISLPSYSPNLNLIERLWKLLKEEVIYNRYYEKFTDFREAIYGFFEEKIPSLKSQLSTRLAENFRLVN